MTLRGVVAGLGMLLVVACGGKTDGQEAGEIEPDALHLTLAPGQQLAPFDADAVAAARAVCTEAEGPVDVPLSGEDLALKLVGAWLHCDDQGNPWAGMQLLPDGGFAVLEDDGDGGLQAASGYFNTGNWNLQGYGPQENPSDSPDATWYLDIYCGGCAAAGAPLLERDPKRMFGHRWGGMGMWVPLGE
jgi:hypothetical protein